MTFDNIPDELKQLNQWVCWKYVDTDTGKRTKVPVDVWDGSAVSVNDSAAFADFWTAVDYCDSGRAHGIGLVLTEADPYTVFDFDHHPEYEVRQKDLITRLASYTEVSPSGKGYHVVARGVCAEAIKSPMLEMYSKQRFITFTGNVAHDLPISDAQAIIDTLLEAKRQNSPVASVNMDAQETRSDRDVVMSILNGPSGLAFNALCTNTTVGDLSADDQAFCNYLATATYSAAQIERIFRASPRGQRDKVRNRENYVYATVRKALDRAGVTLNLDVRQIMTFTPPPIAEMPTIVPPAPAQTFQQVDNPSFSTERLTVFDAAVARGEDIYSVPNGLVGDIAQYLYANAPRQNLPVALAGALALVSGVIGRAYQVSGMGLNQYLIIMSRTGTGKEAMTQGLFSLLREFRTAITNDPAIPHQIRLDIAQAAETVVGPMDFTGSTALQAALGANNCFVSILGEAGFWMKDMTPNSMNVNKAAFCRLLLSTYSASGPSGVLGMKKFSKEENDTAEVKSPAYSFVGESTPHSYFGNIDRGMVSTGLIPRFLHIHAGYVTRQPDNPNAGQFKLTPRLFEGLKILFQFRISSERDDEYKPLDIPFGRGGGFDAEFDRYCDRICNTCDEGDVRAELYTRARQNTLKLASVVAAAENPYSPVISEQVYNWAKALVCHDIEVMAARFVDGGLGGENKIADLDDAQHKEARRVVSEFLSGVRDHDAKIVASHSPTLLASRIMKRSYFSNRLRTLNCFKAHPQKTPTQLVTDCLRTLVNEGQVVLVDSATMSNMYASSGEGLRIVHA